MSVELFSDKNPSLNFWRGKFGNAYTKRNFFNEKRIQERSFVFHQILKKRKIESFLEVGSNMGLNLLALKKNYPKAIVHGIEPNAYALRSFKKKRQKMGIVSTLGDSSFLPHQSSIFDLVLTCACLIHIPPTHLQRATEEIVRVSKRYILCMEYFSSEPEMKIYRGFKNILFKRDFGAFYLEHYPHLEIVEYGFLWKQQFREFDDVHWWLLKSHKGS